MVGVKGRYRYTLVAVSGSSTRRCYIECDSDHLTLTLGGLTNGESGSVGTDLLYNMNIPVEGSPRGRNAVARWVLIEFTGALPAGRSSSTMKVPVMQLVRFNSWVVGSTGTYLGLPVVVRQKFGGRPNPAGGSD